MKALFGFSRPDGDLVRQVLGDSPQAFEELVLRYQRKAYAVAWAAGARGEALDDAVQEAFLRAFRGLPRLESPDSFGPWFLTIVRNAARKQALREERSAEVPLTGSEDSPGPSFEGAAESLEGRELRDLLWRRVAELPEGIREAIFLYYHEGESVREVARALAISGDAAKARLKRGRDLLRGKLWRELGETLREMVPSSREWARRGRRLALLILAALPAALPGVAAAASAASPCAVPAASLLGKLSLGGIAMTGKKLALSMTLALLVVLGGVAVWKLSPRQSGGRPGMEGGRGGLAPLSSARAPAAVESREAAEPARGLPEAAAPPPPAGEVSLEGTIASLEGRPVPEALVLLLPLRAWSEVPSTVRARVLSQSLDARAELDALREAYQALASPAPRASSGPGGEYSFRALAPGEYRVLVSHRAHRPSLDSLAAVERGRTARCDVTLLPARSISGRVVDEAGRAVAGAAVTAETVERSVLAGRERLGEIHREWERGAALLEGPRGLSLPDGSFRLDSLEPGPHVVRASKEGYLEAARTAAAGPVSGSEGEGLVLVLEEGCALAGRVLDGEARPVEGAEVALQAQPGTEVHRLFDWSGRDLQWLRPGSAATGPPSTDAGGRFRIAGLEQGRFRLTLKKSVAPPLFRDVVLAGKLTDLGDLVLESRLSISGRVRGPGGAAVAGARVGAFLPARGVSASNTFRSARPEPVVEAVSGPDGRFLLEGLGAGVFHLRASSEAMADGEVREVSAGATGVEVVLPAGLTVHGKVVDAETGQGLEGVEVRLGFMNERKVVSAAEGSFLARGVPPPDHSQHITLVRAYHPDYGLQSDYRVLAGRDERSPLVVRLSRGESVVGQVVDRRGEPVEGAQLAYQVTHLTPEAQGYDPTEGLRALSGPGGAFSIAGPRNLLSMIGDPRLFLVASHPRRGSGWAPVPLPRSGSSWPEVRVVVGGTAVVRGRVSGEGGKPLPEAQVRLIPLLPSAAGQEEERDQGARAAHTGVDGSYRIEGVEPGPAVLVARAPGHAPRRIEGLEMGTEELELDVVLERGWTLEGRVVDPSGSPLDGAEVVAVPEAPGAPVGPALSEFAERLRRLRARGSAAGRSGTDGRFRLEGLPEGGLRLVARLEGYEAVETPPLVAGEAPPDIVLQRFGAIAGTVRSAGDRRPITAFMVDLLEKRALETDPGSKTIALDYRAASEGELRFWDPAGRFLYDGVRPGEYRLLVRAPGHDFSVQDVTVSSGEEVEVEVLLERGFRIEGRVVDAETGAGVSGASVSAYQSSSRPRGGEIHPFPNDVQTGEDGVFVLAGLRGGKHTLGVHHALYLASAHVSVEVSGTEGPPVEVRMEPAGRLEGTVQGVDLRLPDKGMHHSLGLRPIEKGAARGATPGTSVPPPGQLRLMPEGTYSSDALNPGLYEIVLTRQEMDEGETMRVGPGGMVRVSRPRGPAEVIFSTQVEVRAREVITFDVVIR